MNRSFASLVASVVCLAAVPASAQDFEASSPVVRGQGWSVLSGQTVGAGSNVMHVQFGWPGLTFNFLHGQSSDFDLGARFSMNYGVEGMVDLPGGTDLGMKMQFLGRKKLLDQGKYNLGLWFAPGPLGYFADLDFFGLAIPFGFVLGLNPTSAVVLNVGVDFPLWVGFEDYIGFMIPILVGGGVEYFIDSNVGLTMNFRVGPTIATDNSFFGDDAEVTMEFLMGVAFRL